jgi:L-2,4-diaminobutyric acid acetyltransferase
VILREPGLDDGAAMWRLVQETGMLALNSAYAYLLVAEHFGPTSVVAEIDGELAGFVSAYCPPHKPETVFVWQVGVAEAGRGEGVATRMLFDIIKRPACRERGVRYLDTTIGPGNEASQALFRGFARKLGVEVGETELFQREHFPDPDAYEPEILFRIGPFDAADID